MTPHDFTDWIAGEPGDWQPDWLPFDHPLMPLRFWNDTNDQRYFDS